RVDRVQNKKPTPLKATVRAKLFVLPAWRLSPRLLVLRCFLRPFGGVASRIGMRARAGELALVNDEILGPDRLLGEIAFEDLARAGGIARLRRQRAARDMRGHAVMRHSAPGMIARRRLREPHVAGIACKLAALERAHDRVTVADLAARRVHDVTTALHHADQLVVEHAFSL